VQARLCNTRSGQPALTSGIVVGGALLNGGSLAIPAGFPTKGAIPTWNGKPLCSSTACSGDISPNGAPFKIVYGTGVDVNNGIGPAKSTYTITFHSAHVKVVVNAKTARGDVRIEADRSVLSGTSGLCGNANLKADDDAIPNKWQVQQFKVKESEIAFPSSVPQCPRLGELPKEKKCSGDEMRLFTKHCETKSADPVSVADCTFDCCQGASECPTTTTTTTTTAPSVVVDTETECQGVDCKKDQNNVCSHGTELNFATDSVKVNNLGGLGPGKGGNHIHWSRVAKVDGKWIDCIATPVDDKYTRLNKYKKWRGYNGRTMAKKFNGVYKTRVGSAGAIGTLSRGSFEMNFSFVFTGTSKPATIAWLPLTFYDVDGGKEHLETCDAHSSVLHKPSDMSGAETAGGCFKHKAGGKEVNLPTNFDKLSNAEKKAAVTYIFKDKSHFKLKYTTTYEFRVFLFKGSKAVACADSTTTTTTIKAIAKEATIAKDTTCVGAHCVEDQSHVCSEGLELTLGPSQVSSNNLGGMGPMSGPETIQWKRVAKINGRSIDLIAKSSTANYRKVNMKDKKYGRAILKKFNGVYSKGVGSIGSAQAGTFKIKFTFVDTATQKAVTVKYLPLTFYDVDGGKESLETCDADSWILRKGSPMIASKRGKCFKHKAGKAEVDLPKDWNNLKAKEKQAAVTYVFKNKSTFEMTYATNYKHRVFLFKGSKDVACSKTSSRR